LTRGDDCLEESGPDLEQSIESIAGTEQRFSVRHLAQDRHETIVDLLELGVRESDWQAAFTHLAYRARYLGALWRELHATPGRRDVVCRRGSRAGQRVGVLTGSSLFGDKQVQTRPARQPVDNVAMSVGHRCFSGHAGRGVRKVAV